MSNDRNVSLRFRTRLWADNLPTLDSESRMAKEPGKKRDLYQDDLGEGTCKCCSSGEIEGRAHIMTCEHRDRVTSRQKMWHDIDVIWEGTPKVMRQELEWFTPRSGWRLEWTWMGMVPKEVISSIYRYDVPLKQKTTLHSCVNKTAKRIMQEAASSSATIPQARLGDL